MLINAEEINKILSLSGNQITARGKKYFEQSRVKIADFEYVNDNNYIAKIYVEGSYIYEVNISKKDGILSYNCNCPYAQKAEISCKHVIAAIFDMYINEINYLTFVSKKESAGFDKSIIYNKTYKDEKNERIENDGIISYYENLQLAISNDKEKIEIIPTLELYEYLPELQVSFKIGSNKMYILHDLLKFSEAVLSKEKLKYGKNLEFVHDFSAFNEESMPLAEFIVKRIIEYNEYASLSNYFNLPKKDKGIIKLKYSALDDFFDMFEGREINIDDYDYDKNFGIINFINANPDLKFNVLETDKGISISHEYQDYYIFEGQKYVYMLFRNSLYRCDEEFKINILPLIKEFKKKNQDTLYISKKNCTSLCEYVIPYINKKCKLTIDDGLIDKYKAEKLEIKIYLDLDSNLDVIAQVEFIYKDKKLNPFNDEQSQVCNRNIIEEARVKELLKNYKFVINFKKGIIYLNKEEDIYEFFTTGIDTLNKYCEVFITEKLKNRKIIAPKSFTMGVRIDNEFLKLDIDNLGLSEQELKDIFQSYKQKKKYYRLKDGSFLNINISSIDTLAKLAKDFDISPKELVKGEVSLPKYRAIYLENLIKNNKDIKVKKDSRFEDVVKSISNAENIDSKLPDNMEKILRSYQKTGYNWLKTLENYNFGGILADDMGLGKTIQVIALLLDEKIGHKGTSIVVCPSSLYINWEKEIKKFAPELNVLVISGDAIQRENLIKDISKNDVVITSYDLLKRDVDNYLDFEFKYIIADEAQYIKNNNTKNAKALKKLKGKNRFALTGTPIENSLSELWSIFDFIMPGYLFNYKRFKDEFETPIIKDDDKLAIQRLQKLVAPFILRRIKKEVLKELPDKTETIMYSKMEDKQKELYVSYLAKAKEDMQATILQNGLEKSKIKILAIITRLRQLCCHPSLFIENYNGESAKLNQCIELVKDATLAGHKVLLFSQFTSMFDIIKKELDDIDITYFELTGNTKVDTRVDMVDKFNNDKNIQVFLISLKAGGTGLNLIGADVVIHYDPWWNLSVQNQATDRAYRIGQRRNVQVFKLITEDSIEEKIEMLQQRKMDMTNSVIKEGETFINKLSNDELLELFE